MTQGWGQRSVGSPSKILQAITLWDETSTRKRAAHPWLWMGKIQVWEGFQSRAGRALHQTRVGQIAAAESRSLKSTGA